MTIIEFQAWIEGFNMARNGDEPDIDQWKAIVDEIRNLEQEGECIPVNRIDGGTIHLKGIFPGDVREDKYEAPVKKGDVLMHKINLASVSGALITMEPIDDDQLKVTISHDDGSYETIALDEHRTIMLRAWFRMWEVMKCHL